MTSELNKDMIILDWILNAKKCYINDLSRVGGFMGTLYYGTYSKDEVREIYESKGIGLI